MTPYAYPGFPHYLRLAAKRLGLPVALEGEARRSPSLTRLANLIAQTAGANTSAAASTLAAARDSRDTLAIATLAAELSLIDAHAAHGLDAPDFRPPAPPPGPTGEPPQLAPTDGVAPDGRDAPPGIPHDPARATPDAPKPRKDK